MNLHIEQNVHTIFTEKQQPSNGHVQSKVSGRQEEWINWKLREMAKILWIKWNHSPYQSSVNLFVVQLTYVWNY